MRVYTVITIQFIIWSSFTLAEWLSKKDWLIYKAMMFIVFFYLAVVIGNYFIQSMKKTLFTTMVSLILYGSLHFIILIIPSTIFYLK